MIRFNIIIFFLCPFWLFSQTSSESGIDSLVAEAKEIYYASPDESMKMAIGILEAADRINYTKGRLEALRLIGNSHYLIGRMDSAAIYMLQLLNEAYDANDKGMQADVMIDIGQTYDKIGLHSLAYDYFQQAHQIRLEIGNIERLSVTFINLAYHHYLRDQLDSALFYYGKTAEILDTIPLTYTKPFLYNELGGVYLKQEKYKLARENIHKAIELNKQLKNNWDLSFNYVTLAQLELKEGNLNAAEENANNAVKVSEESNISLEFDLIYKILSEVKTKQGDHKKALEFLSRSYSYADSLDLALTNQKILALDHYKRDKENQITTLKLKNENIAQGARFRNQRIILISTTIVLIITLVAFGLLFQQNKKLREAKETIQTQNEDLRSLNTTKDKLFSIITHDIRNPLNTVNGMLKLARDGNITQEDFNRFTGSMVDQTDRLSTLFETLVNWSITQQEGLNSTMEMVDLEEVIDQSFNYVNYMARNKQVELIKVPEGGNHNLESDANMLLLILNNLLTNAIKFTPSGGEVKVSVLDEGDKMVVKVKDTGIGVEEGLVNQIRDGKVHSQLGTKDEKGTGIGLILTLDLVRFIGGTLEAERNEIGSTFSVLLPKSPVTSQL